MVDQAITASIEAYVLSARANEPGLTAHGTTIRAGCQLLLEQQQLACSSSLMLQLVLLPCLTCRPAWQLAVRFSYVREQGMVTSASTYGCLTRAGGSPASLQFPFRATLWIAAMTPLASSSGELVVADGNSFAGAVL